MSNIVLEYAFKGDAWPPIVDYHPDDNCANGPAKCHQLCHQPLQGNIIIAIIIIIIMTIIIIIVLLKFITFLGFFLRGHCDSQPYSYAGSNHIVYRGASLLHKGQKRFKGVLRRQE